MNRAQTRGRVAAPAQRDAFLQRALHGGRRLASQRQPAGDGERRCERDADEGLEQRAEAVDERVRAPYGPRARTLRGRSLEEIAALGALDEGRAMEDVSIDAVEAAALDLLHAGGLR